MDLNEKVRTIAREADVLAGGERLLGAFPDFKGERVCIGAHAKGTAEQLAHRAQTENVVVLASGDALFFGIGSLFISLLPPEQLTILPNLTAAQTALSMLKVSWSKTRFFSVHGRSRNLPWQTILQSPSAVIYADPECRPSNIACTLIERYPPAATRKAAIVENLGLGETIQTGTLEMLSKANCGGFSMLVLLEAEGTTPPLAIGLPDETYAHENGLITHPEVRAVVLSKLQLVAGVMWDLGAGSGSVGVEAAGLCDGLNVFAVEKNESRVAQIEENINQRGVPNVKVQQGSLPEALSGLPSPDRVFIGGGGSDIIKIIEQAYEVLSPGGRVVATAVMQQTQTALQTTLTDACIETVEIAVRRSGRIGSGHMLRPENPVMIFVFEKDK